MRKADDLIQRFLDSIGQTEGSVYVELFRGWRAVVGEHLAAHAQPVDIRGHSLVIEADHPGWSQMVMMRRDRIMRELGRRFPELGITGLMVRVVDVPGRSRNEPRDATSSQNPSPAPPHRGAGASPNTADTPVRDHRSASPAASSRDEHESLERIADDELRSLLGRLREDLDERP